MVNLTALTVNSSGVVTTAGTFSTLDNIIGTAGTASAQVLSIQGVTSGVAITVASHAVTNAGTFAVQASQTTAANLNATVVGTGTFATQSTVTQATASSLNATVVGTGTFAVQATLQTSATTAIGKVDPNTIGTWGLVVSTQNSATPTNMHLMAGQFNTSPTAITSGNVSALQLDASGNLLVNIKAGAGSGGTALADEAAFTEGTTSFTPIGGVFKTSQTALTSGQAGAVALSAAREMNTLSKVWDGTNTGTVKAASTAALATDTAIVVAISPNGQPGVGRKAPAASVPTVAASQAYNTVAAGQSAQALTGGSGGAAGDFLDFLLVVPGTTGAGAVSIKDGSGSAITLWVGGGTTALVSLVPFAIPVRAVSTGGAWSVTTGTNVTVVATGNFT